MKVLAIGCHPDDLEIGCAGTLAKYKKLGHEVQAVHVCNGNLGHVVIEPDELRKIRIEEKKGRRSCRYSRKDPRYRRYSSLRRQQRAERYDDNTHR